jgi:hypothetical protein
MISFTLGAERQEVDFFDDGLNLIDQLHTRR